jgi:hypothetical protein
MEQPTVLFLSPLQDLKHGLHLQGRHRFRCLPLAVVVVVAVAEDHQIATAVGALVVVADKLLQQRAPSCQELRIPSS